MIVCGNFKHLSSKIQPLNISSKEMDGDRFYQTPDGVFPSVTTVTGWEKRKFFAEWRRKNPEESKRVCSRGTNLHTIVEKYLLNEKVNADNLEGTVRDLFLLIKPEVDKINNIRCLEAPLWSKTIGLAGRVDCIAEYNRELSVIDFKGSTNTKNKSDIENYFLQATAYSLMWQDLTGEKVKKLKILVACENGIMQVFDDSIINYVSKLKDTIENYHREKTWQNS
jgi:genome maintenance exonuclease 1